MYLDFFCEDGTSLLAMMSSLYFNVPDAQNLLEPVHRMLYSRPENIYLERITSSKKITITMSSILNEKQMSSGAQMRAMHCIVDMCFDWTRLWPN